MRYFLYASSNKNWLEMSIDPLHEKKGRNGTLKVYPEYVEIDRKSSKIFANITGLYGSKRIYYSDMGSIQFKKSGLSVGFIQFSILGGRDTSGVMNTVKNENAITFGQHNKQWEKLYLRIQQMLDDHKNREKSGIKPTSGIADELMKAAELFEKGLISKDEYDKIKQKILF